MRKRFTTLITILILALALVVPAHAEVQYMWATVYSWNGQYNGDGSPVLSKITSGITFKVLAVDSDTAETLYYYNTPAMTSLTNPVTTTNFESSTVCDDRIAFAVDPTDATYDRYVDLLVVDTNGGYSARVENFDKYTHSVVIDERPGIMHTGTIWWSETTTGEADTGVDFLADTIISNVFVETVTLAAGQTISVGLLSSETSGDADGFIKTASNAAAGWANPRNPTITAATTETYVSTASVVGALMGSSLAGAATATDEGSAYLWEHVVTGANAKSLTYTMATTTGAADGYIYYQFTRVR